MKWHEMRTIVRMHYFTFICIVLVLMCMGWGDSVASLQVVRRRSHRMPTTSLMSAWNERNPSNRLGFIKSAFKMHSTAPSAESASSVSSSMQKESSPSTKTFVYDAKKIRNFSIIAHIDHGKSTLADRLLEATQTVHARDMQNQLLDNLDIERERGITIKLQAARMIYHAKDGENYLLNLIDTPGHVDFGYEVSRSLAACEGALVVVDASQGVEAQTVANVYLALENNLEIIPVINKIDLPAADPIAVKSEIESTIGLDCTDAIVASAKTGLGIENILEAVVNRLPPPLNANSSAPLQALIFDSYYDAYRGVVVFFRVVQGSIQRGDKIKFMNSGMEYEVLEVGVMTPTKLKVDDLRAGEVGYLAANIKAVDHARVGDTITQSKYMPQQGSSHPNLPTVKPLPGYAPAKQMVFAGLYPSNSDDYEALRDAIAKLKLNDAAFSYFPETSQAMGFGFRCGFLGLLHMDIIQERLEREYDLDLIITAPSVVYKVLLNKSKKKSAVVTNASGGHTLYEQYARPDSSAATSQHSSRDAETVDSDEWLEHKVAEKEKGHQNEDELYDVMYVDTPSKMPDPAEYVAIQEPYVRLEMFCPSEYTGTLMDLAQTRRGISKELKYSSPTRATLIYEIPLAEVITNFFDQLKSRTKGYASMSFVDIGFRTNQLVRLDIRINGEDAAPLATIVHRDKAYDVGKKICQKLKELIPRQQFRVPIQAMIGNKPVASAHISAVMKDVLAKCYGGDISRKKKLLQKQARGKKRMKALGKVNVPQEAFMAVIRLDDDNDGNNSS